MFATNKTDGFFTNFDKEIRVFPFLVEHSTFITYFSLFSKSHFANLKFNYKIKDTATCSVTKCSLRRRQPNAEIINRLVLLFVTSQIENYTITRLHEHDVDINGKCWQGCLKEIFNRLQILNAGHIK